MSDPAGTGTGGRKRPSNPDSNPDASPAARPRTGPLYSLPQLMQTQSRDTGPLQTLASFLDPRSAAALSRTAKAATSDASIKRALEAMRRPEPLEEDEPSFLEVSGHATFPLDKLPLGGRRACLDVPPKRWATDGEKRRHFDLRAIQRLAIGYDTVNKPGLRNLTVRLQPGEARILESERPMHLATLHVHANRTSEMACLVAVNIQADLFEQRGGCVYAHALQTMKASVVDVDRVCVDNGRAVADLDTVEAFTVRHVVFGIGRICLRNTKKVDIGRSGLVLGVDVCVGPEVTHLTARLPPCALSRGVEWRIPAGLVELDVTTDEAHVVRRWGRVLGEHFASEGDSALQVLRLPAFRAEDLETMAAKRWPVLREFEVACVPELPAGALPSLETLDVGKAPRGLGFAGPRLDLVRLHNLYYGDLPSGFPALTTETGVLLSGAEKMYTWDDTVSLAAITEIKVTVDEDWEPPSDPHRLARCLEVGMHGANPYPGVLAYMLLCLSPRVVFAAGKREDGMGSYWEIKARVVNAPLSWLREVARLRGAPDHTNDEALLSHREELECSARVGGWR